MSGNFMPAGVEYLRILPEISLTIVGVLIMVLEPLLGEHRRNFFAGLSIAGLAAAMWAAIFAYSNPGPAFQDMLVIDGFATFFRIVVIGVGLLTVLCSMHYLRVERAGAAEFYALILFSIVGQSIIVTAGELIMVFIGLEISSIASYVLAGYLRDDKRNNESALKYFLLGSFATAFLLYGIAWIYGTTGSTNLLEIRRVLSNKDIAPPIALVGMAAALMFVGFAFKVSAVPFQIWAPDVYQGASAPISAFLSTGPKAAAFAVFLRVFLTAFEPIRSRWEPLVWTTALLTMIVGNFAALMQPNIKRLLAYSSIANAGYVLVAIAAQSEVGTAAAMFYLAAYAFMQVGAFAVVTHFARQGEKYVKVDDLAGLGQRQPVTAGMLSIFLLSLIGVPLTGGFFGKFYIFKAALDSHLVGLTVIGLLTTAVAAFYYLRIIVVMYMREPVEESADLPPLAP
ncbi:MAG TPA: NADH-quinone oxidoreductase subunit N, partial [Bryobacteraceae bacterium]|nr:NADH-quinone oxidoreductase subunit N [Bryobacteraceae bacterium]